jgi:RHS repeat-associated protein
MYQADNLNTSINTPGVTAFAYTWDANKRKLSQTETGIPLNNQTYSYDDEDRLASFNRNNGDNQAWNLSLVGDWNQFNNNGNVENRTHNAVHEITTVDATPLVHDVKGNLTTNKNGQTYAWDIENRLQSATVPAGRPDSVTGTHTYTYDALGRRVSKTVGGNTTVFISDGMQEIAEYVNGVFSQSYVYGSYIDEPLLKTDSAGNKIYYHSNNLFSIAALTDNAGTVVERYKYDPYGKAAVLAADGITVRPNSLYENDITWEGRRTDRETNLMYFRQRMYSLDLGIFISRFYKMRVDRHFYRFQFNAPTTHIDPWGDPDFGEYLVDGIKTGLDAMVSARPSAQNAIIQGMNWISDELKKLPPPSEFSVQGVGMFQHHDLYFNNAQIRTGYGGMSHGVSMPNDMNYKGKLTQTDVGTIKWGSGANKPCKCATPGDIIDCLKKGPYPRLGEYTHLANSCQHHVEFLINNCCLKGYDATGIPANAWYYTDDTERKWIQRQIMDYINKNPTGTTPIANLEREYANKLLKTCGCGFGNKIPPGGVDDLMPWPLRISEPTSQTSEKTENSTK